MEPFEWVLCILILLLLLFIVFVLPFYLLFGGWRKFAAGPLQRCYEGINCRAVPLPGDVVFVYHTYRGLLVFVTQDEHRVAAAPADAERLLGRLLRFNLTWGMLSYGMLFIPILSIGNYFAQRRSIRHQAVEDAH